MSLRLRSPFLFFFFFNDTATTEIYTLSLHELFRSLPEVRCGTAGGLPEARCGTVGGLPEVRCGSAGGLPEVRCGSVGGLPGARRGFVRSCRARSPRTPRRRLLVRVRSAQDAGLIERLANELETDREPLGAEPTRHRDCGEPRHVRRDGEDIVQVHRERVFLLPVLEGDVRRHGRDDQVHATERGVAGSEMRSTVAPSPRSTSTAVRTVRSTSASMPSMKYSSGRPSRSPCTPGASAAA